jgi:DNA-binding response OmpR family regulator
VIEQILLLFQLIKNKRLKTKIISIIPDNSSIKETLLSYGSDDYLCKPYQYEDLILRCKNLINCIPRKYELIYETQFLKYIKKFNIVKYNKTYIPLTPREVLIVKLLIKRSFVQKSDIKKYLQAKTGKNYAENYMTTLIYRIRKKIKLSTGRDLIRNKYGSGYYIL